MKVSRRDVLMTGAAAAMWLGAGRPARAQVSDDEARFDALMAEFKGDPALSRQVRSGIDKLPLPVAGGRVMAPKAKPSKLRISPRAMDLIVYSEITNQRTYEKLYQAATVPGGESGVTIGIGYDIGHTDEGLFLADWRAYLTPEQLDRLLIATTLKRQRAKDVATYLKDIKIVWRIAQKQFVERQLPIEIGLTESKLVNFKLLPEDCRGALVSLTYNRGAGRFVAAPDPSDSMDKGREMRAILDHMRQQDFERIPDEFMSMRRIWVDKPDMAGVVKRREAEALLFRIGLAKMAAARPPG